MNTQTAYEKIRAYFSKPGATLAKWYDDETGDTKCQYLAPDGRKCAVGCLIPRQLYTEDIENKSSDVALAMLHNNDPKKYEIVFGGVNLTFLDQAQEAHDNDADSAAELVGILDSLAEDYGLTVAA